MNAVDLGQIQKSTELFLLGLDSCISLQNISGLQIKTPDLGRRNIDIIFPREVIFTANKAISVWKHFQNTVGCHPAVQAVNIMQLPVSGIG